MLALALFSTGARAGLLVSNLDEPVGGVGTIDRGQWIASPFQTNDAAAWFSLESIVLSLDGGDGSNQFSVVLYEADGNKPSSAPYSVLLGNANPETPGQFTYLPDGGVTLQANTIYWVAAQVATGTGEYDWNYTPAGTTGQWTIPNLVSFYQDGGWSEGQAWGPHQFGVSAQPVPEPCSFALVALGTLLCATLRLRQNRHRRAKP